MGTSWSPYATRSSSSRKKPKKAPKTVQEDNAAEGFSLPSLFSSSGGSESEVKQFVLNPSDDIDDDERSFDEWTLRNPFLFLFIFLTPTIIYLGFYILGSLEII